MNLREFHHCHYPKPVPCLRSFDIWLMEETLRAARSKLGSLPRKLQWTRREDQPLQSLHQWPSPERFGAPYRRSRPWRLKHWGRHPPMMFHVGCGGDLAGGIGFWTVDNFMFQCSNWLVWVVCLDGFNQHLEWGTRRGCVLRTLMFHSIVFFPNQNQLPRNPLQKNKIY